MDKLTIAIKHTLTHAHAQTVEFWRKPKDILLMHGLWVCGERARNNMHLYVSIFIYTYHTGN